MHKNRLPSLNHLILVLAGTLALSACTQGLTPEKWKRLGSSKLTNEQEIIAFIGPGQEIKDSYTKSIIAAHNLPSSARFLRYSIRSEPGIFRHVVLVDGKLAELDTWDSRKQHETNLQP